MSTSSHVDASPAQGDGISGRRRPAADRLRPLRSRTGQFLIALGLYTAFTVWLSWPVPIHLGSSIYGAPGDLTGSIALLRELVEGHHNPFLPGRLADLNAPEGMPIAWPLNLASWPSAAFLYGTGVAFGATAAFNIYTLLGFIASAVAMFLLARTLFGSFWAALIAGFAFAFYPFSIINGGGHNFAVHGWVFVLIAWRALALGERPNVRNALWAAAAVTLAISWFPYFIVMGGVLYATLAAGAVLVAALRHRLRAQLLPQALCGALVLAYLAALRLITAGSPQGDLRQHSIDELYVYSARPLEYLLPPGGSEFVGGTTGPFLAQRLHGSNPSESTLYVGVTMLALALVGLRFVVRRGTDTRTRIAGVLIAAAGAVAFAFSAPPKVSVLGHTVPFPSLFVFDISSTWRAYSRFVMVVMLAVCLLAALGLAQFLLRHSWRVAAPLVAVLLVAVPLDLYVKPFGGRTTTLTHQPILDVLARQPPGGVAQYPLFPNGYGDYADIYYQDVYDKPLLNGFAGTPQESRDLSLANLAAPGTAAGLATLGVRYVFITRIPISPPVVNPGRPGRGFQFVAKGAWGLNTAEIYRVTARPRGALLTLQSGFGDAEQSGPQQLRWLTARQGQLDLNGRCAPCAGRLRFTATSLARPRRLKIATQDGHVLLNRVIAAPTKIDLRLRFDRRLALVATTSPGPEPVAKAIPGSSDPRSVSVSFTNLRFR